MVRLWLRARGHAYAHACTLNVIACMIVTVIKHAQVIVNVITCTIASSVIRIHFNEQVASVSRAAGKASVSCVAGMNVESTACSVRKQNSCRRLNSRRTLGCTWNNRFAIIFDIDFRMYCTTSNFAHSSDRKILRVRSTSIKDTSSSSDVGDTSSLFKKTSDLKLQRSIWDVD